MTHSFSLKDIQGKLSHLRTTEGVARRRHPAEQDRDGWILTGNPFFADQHWKIGTSKALRRLGHKKQVFSQTGNPHVRNRLTHVHEVVKVATMIASILGLNVELVAAIALGHDLGHTPFGHTGEEFITKVAGIPFRHEQFGVVIAQHIERSGIGLNLTWQTLQGILQHSRGADELTECSFQEATVVMYADKIAYTFADVNDVERCFKPLDELPEIQELLGWFGSNQDTRIRRCILALCNESGEKGTVSFKDSEEAINFAQLKELLYQQVYFELEEMRNYERACLHNAFEHLKRLVQGISPWVALALLTDDEVIQLARARRIHLPHIFPTLSVSEIIPHLKQSIDYTNVDLDW
ncbi:MAG: HD domain-containing protein [Candidatus Magasanikbacteria bacterium]